MAIRNKQQATVAIEGGLVAGLVGGLVLTIYMLIGAVVQTHDVWATLKGAAAPILGTRAFQPGFDAAALLVGLVCHFLVAAVWGGLFGVLFYGISRNATLWSGVLWGIVTWIGMYYIVLPLVGMGDVAMSVPIAPAIVSHMIFGIAVALGFLPYQRHEPRLRRPKVGPPLAH